MGTSIETCRKSASTKIGPPEIPRGADGFRGPVRRPQETRSRWPGKPSVAHPRTDNPSSDRVPQLERAIPSGYAASPLRRKAGSGKPGFARCGNRLPHPRERNSPREINPWPRPHRVRVFRRISSSSSPSILYQCFTGPSMMGVARYEGNSEVEQRQSGAE